MLYRTIADGSFANPTSNPEPPKTRKDASLKPQMHTWVAEYTFAMSAMITNHRVFIYEEAPGDQC